MKIRRITIDLRMYAHSGIGRYLHNLMPLLVPQLHADALRILVPEQLVAGAAWLADTRIELRDTSVPIYSVPEQMLGLRGAYRDTNLLWVPHINAPLWYRSRMAITLHDLSLIAIPELLPNSLKRGYAKLLIERAVAQAAAILCVSEFTASEAVSRLDVAPAKLTVTPLGVDPGWPSHAEPHREPDAVPYLLFVGNVKPNKNLSVLLTAFARAGEVLPHRLVLAGRMRGFGTGDEAVIGQAEMLGDRVRWAGEVSDQQLIALYAGATALVMPSLYEGFGLPVLEAMHFGCPVIAADTSSLPEVAQDAAIYFNPRDPEALYRCLLRVGDDTLMKSLGAAGQRRARHFSYARCAQQTANVLNRLLETNP